MGITAEQALRIADEWWARELGCGAHELRPRSARVQGHAGGLVGQDGIWILVAGPAPVVSLPRALLPVLGERARWWSRQTVEDPRALLEELAPTVPARIIGPAFIGYASEDSLRGAGGPQARLLSAADREAVARLRETFAPEEWEEGGTDAEQSPAFGAFDAGGELRALAGYERWDRIAHISIACAAGFRNRGFGASAVTRAAEHALSRGLVPQYRALRSNAPSLRVAAKLGFQEYGFSMLLRLTAAAAAI
jgi:GNAT superfamily N-acetyltransferase